MTVPNDFGHRIRAARAYKNDMTRDDLGRRLGVSPGYIKGLEGGKKPDALKAYALVARLPEITGLPEAFFLGQAANGVADELAAIRDLLLALRAETAARDAEAMQLLDDRLPPIAGIPQQRPA